MTTQRRGYPQRGWSSAADQHGTTFKEPGYNWQASDTLERQSRAPTGTPSSGSKNFTPKEVTLDKSEYRELGIRSVPRWMMGAKALARAVPGINAAVNAFELGYELGELAWDLWPRAGMKLSEDTSLTWWDWYPATRFVSFPRNWAKTCDNGGGGNYYQHSQYVCGQPFNVAWSYVFSVIPNGWTGATSINRYRGPNVVSNFANFSVTERWERQWIDPLDGALYTNLNPGPYARVQGMPVAAPVSPLVTELLSESGYGENRPFGGSSGNGRVFWKGGSRAMRWERTRRPPKRKKEKKVITKAGGSIGAAFGAVTEFSDAVDAIFSAIPLKQRLRDGITFKKPPGWESNSPGALADASLLRKTAYIATHFDQVDIEKAVWNLASNQLEDFAIGKASGLADTVTKNPHWVRSVGVGNTGLR